MDRRRTLGWKPARLPSRFLLLQLVLRGHGAHLLWGHTWNTHTHNIYQQSGAEFSNMIGQKESADCRTLRLYLKALVSIVTTHSGDLYVNRLMDIRYETKGGVSELKSSQFCNKIFLTFWRLHQNDGNSFPYCWVPILLPCVFFGL